MAEWPAVEGRYTLGNQDSPVAVCTLGTPVLDVPMDSIAIKGPCVIENIGIEKVVRNTISNPKLRFLVLCGSESKGHFTGQALKALKGNGMDENKRIIGAKGAMPFLRSLSSEEVEAFRRQVEIVDLTGERDPDAIAKAARGCAARNAGPVSPAQSVEAPVENIAAGPSFEWEEDPKGFFIIHANGGRIAAEHYTPDRRLQRVITGHGAGDIYKKIHALGLVSLHSHASYLGKELAKAEAALREGKEYIQE